MADDERRSSTERRSDKDQRSGAQILDPRTSDDEAENGARITSDDRAWTADLSRQ